MISRKSDSDDNSKDESRKRIIELRITEQFDKDYGKLDSELQDKVGGILSKILSNADFSPGMRPGKLTGDIWYIRVDRNIRITYSKEKGGILILRRVGDHRMLKKP